MRSLIIMTGAGLLLAACSGLPPLWSTGVQDADVAVEQVGAEADCASQGSNAVVTAFASGEALRAWAGERRRDGLVSRARPGRPYAVVELGQDSGAAGLAVARDARIEGGRLILQISRLSASRGDTGPLAPCAVVALPSQWREGMPISVVGSAGNIIARSAP